MEGRHNGRLSFAQVTEKYVMHVFYSVFLQSKLYFKISLGVRRQAESLLPIFYSHKLQLLVNDRCLLKCQVGWYGSAYNCQVLNSGFPVAFTLIVIANTLCE